MDKIDSVVKKETLYIAYFVLILSALMQSVFLIIKMWDYTVLTGNLLSGIIAILNFFLMGITVQSATKKDEKAAVASIRLSQNLRMLMLFVTTALGVLLDCFNIAAVIIPLFFPRIAIALRPLLIKDGGDGSK